MELKELKEEKEIEEAEESLVTTSPVDLELKELKEEKKNEEAEESLVTSSPVDLDWGKELPAPTPSVAAPSTPMWRPWEENICVVNLSAMQRGRGRAQLPHPAAGNDYKCGLRRRNWPASCQSCGQHHRDLLSR